MSSLKENIVYSGILTVSLYFLQFVTYPYVLRILGVNNLGIYNYYTGFVNFFTLFSALGIPLLGIREISKASHSSNPEFDTAHVFSGLFYLNGLMTVFALIAYGISAIFLVKSDMEWLLVAAGAVSIVANMFTVEWFFRGIEKFKFITIRALAIRILFVVLVFAFIKDPSDYILYFIFSIASVVASGIINWIYKSNFTKLERFDFKSVQNFIYPSFGLGVYLLIGSYYQNIFPVVLGNMSSMSEVGFYTTAVKLILIILLLFNSYTQAVLPRISYADDAQSRLLINNSFEIISLITPPLTCFIIVEAPDIIQVIAGCGYEGAILPMRISSAIIILGCINQVITNNVLLPEFRDKCIVIAFLSGVLVGLGILLLADNVNAVTCSVCWCASELVILFIQVFFSRRMLLINKHAFKLFIKSMFLSCLILILFFINKHIDIVLIRLLVSSLFLCVIIFLTTKKHISRK